MQQKNKLDCYKGGNCLERFCKGLRDHAMKIISYEEKEMIPLTDKENKSYEKQKFCYIYKKEFGTDENDKNAFKLYHKVRDHCHYTGKFRRAARSICNLRYKTPKEIPVVFHNGSKKKIPGYIMVLFAHTYELCNGDINRFILLLRKGLYPYEYMDSWERFNETFPDKKSFYSELNLEDITDKDYAHAQKGV